MNDYGLVSIITPNWNCAKYVSETIRSVHAQTYQNWEMIIVDDCSTDESCEVVAPYVEQDVRIRLLKNPKNSGAAVSRNYALREAKGKWIAFLDSDDLLAKYRRGRVGSVSTHGYSTLIKWHYKLWHEAEGMNAVASVFWTGVNLMCGVWKKLRYVKRDEVVE